MQLNAGQVIAKRYEIVEKLGVGGMAVVYMAKDLKLDRYVTFKVLKEEHLQDEFVFSKFTTEARAAASLSNQNIVSVYDVGLEDNIHYIVMEYVDGLTLKELIKARAPFDDKEAIGVAIQIAQALEHAHENSVVHQDIKPQNILITHNGVIKVTDFGIASANTSTTSTMTTKAVGSVHYFSPEQAKGRYVDNRSDIYSLGIVMFEMMTGVIPFDGDSSVTIALKHINDKLPDIAELNPNVSKSLINIILKATSKLSSQRYTKISEMIDDLKSAMTNDGGEFVKQADESSPTIMLRPEEQEMIRRGSRLPETEAKPTSERDFTLPPKGFKQDMPPKTTASRQQTEPEFDIFENKSRRKDAKYRSLEQKITYIGIGAAAFVIILIATLIFTQMFRSGGYTVVEGIQTPDFVGQTLEDALAFATENDIELNYSAIYNESFEKGLIFEQYPLAGDTLEDQMTVTISLGDGVIEMPSLFGKTLDDAEAFFAPTPYDFHIQIVSHSTIPPGTIINQTPLPDVILTEGMQIVLEISTGPDAVTVTLPDLVGMSEANAIATIQNLGLSLGSVTRANHPSVPEGTVVNMLGSRPGTVVEGSSVGLVVSAGPEQQATTPEVEEPAIDDNTDADEPNGTYPAPDTGAGYEEITTLPEEITPPTLSHANVLFSLPAGYDDMETVHLMVLDAATNDQVFNQNVSTANFPVGIPVEGTGQMRLLFFIYNTLVGDEMVYFN